MMGPGTDEKTDVIGVFNGYTEAEEVLRPTEEQLRTISDNVPQLIWTNLPNGEANYFNKRWYEFTGLSYEQSRGPGWQAVVHPEDAFASTNRGRNHSPPVKYSTANTDCAARMDDTGGSSAATFL